MIKNSIPNEAWGRRLWRKEGKTFPGIYQNPRGMFLYYTHPTAQIQNFSPFFLMLYIPL